MLVACAGGGSDFLKVLYQPPTQTLILMISIAYICYRFWCERMVVPSDRNAKASDTINFLSREDSA